MQQKASKKTVSDKMIEYFRKKPLEYIREILGVENLTDSQREIVNLVWHNKYTGVKAAHNVGKTFIEACIVLTYVSLYEDSIVITTAPTARQVRDLLWTEINRLFNKSEYEIGGDMRVMSFVKGPRWFAAGITTESGKDETSAVKLQGYHAKRILVVIDEAVGVEPSIWEAVDGITSSERAKVLALGNPSTINFAFKKHLDRNDWNTNGISAFNHPNVRSRREIIPGAVSYRWVKDKIEKWCKVTNGIPEENKEHIFRFNGRFYKPNDFFLWKVLGEFPDEASNGVIPLVKIQNAMSRCKPDEEPDAEKFCHMGIDVARFGADHSVFAINKNNHFTIIPFYQLDTAKLTGEAVNLIKHYKPTRVSVDCDGIGAGVFDNLNEAKNEGIIETELFELHSGSNPVEFGQTEDFFNLRAQMYWLFKTDIDKISLEPDDDIEEGFSTMRYYFNTKGKLQIESKDEIKKRLGRSPDAEDAIVYCNFLKYTDSNVSGTFDYSNEEEKHETVTEKIGV
jgi:phage terminase large subunit